MSPTDTPELPELPELPQGTATGLGSWPGEDMREALSVVRDELTDLPHLPELPARDPGADLIGRGAALLVDLPVDLQPHGWRLVDHPGREARRATAYLRGDLDELAEAFDGYTGPFKVQVTGPWTLAASLWLARGERALTDEGARRDVGGSLAEGVRRHLAAVRDVLPGASLVLQVDEPSLPSVLAGRLPTASGYGRVRVIEESEVVPVLADVAEAGHALGARVAVHCCASDAPVALFGRSGFDAVSVDVSLLDAAGWEDVAAIVEAGPALWAGVVPTSASGAAAPDAVTPLLEAVRRPWRRIGLPLEGLARVVATPTCGLAGLTPAGARSALVQAVSVGRALAEAAHDA